MERHKDLVDNTHAQASNDVRLDSWQGRLEQQRMRLLQGPDCSILSQADPSLGPPRTPMHIL